MTPIRRRAFTVIELLVVIAIIGLLVALVMSAVQRSRESSRRIECSNKLKQIGIAISAFESSNGYFPHGMREHGFSFLTQILPQMEMMPVYDQLDFSVSMIDPRNRPVEAIRVAAFVCPSDSSALDATGYQVSASYAANFGTGVQTFGYNGFFRYLYLDGPIRVSDIRDGLSHTAAVSELLVGNGARARGRVIYNTPTWLGGSAQLDAFAGLCRSMTLDTPQVDVVSRGKPWTYGSLPCVDYNHVLPPNENSCYNYQDVQRGAFSAASMHPQGVNLLYGDGSVVFVSDAVDFSTWRAMGSRNGDEAFSF